MKIEAHRRLQASRSQDWYSKLTAEEREAYRLKFPGTKFHQNVKLTVNAVKATKSGTRKP